MNLFLATRSMATSKEDHLTEFFAAAMELSPLVRRRYFDVVLNEFLRRKGWGQCEIQYIATQAAFEGTSCRPDLLLTLSNGRRIICEHKLDAGETLGPECDDSRGQLSRYLELPVDGVVYVRSSWKPPEMQVLAHPKYVRPANREHFLWRDFYPLFESAGRQICELATGRF